jgi:hypothetical protein
MEHLTAAALEAGLDGIRRSPSDHGRVDLIVRRPAVDTREVLAEATLDRAQGLVGDTWPARPSNLTPDRSPHPDLQLTLMNCRVAALVAGADGRRQLAGDQLYVDLDLSEANLPPGTRLAVGSAVIEISDKPHRGCRKFAARFGQEALAFVNSPVGRQLRLRGVNAKIVTPGTVHVGDTIRKRPAERPTSDPGEGVASQQRQAEDDERLEVPPVERG